MKKALTIALAALTLASCNKEEQPMDRTTYDGSKALIMRVKWRGLDNGEFWCPINFSDGYVTTFDTTYTAYEGDWSGQWTSDDLTIETIAPYDGWEKEVVFDGLRWSGNYYEQMNTRCRIYGQKGDQWSNYRADWEILFPCHPHYDSFN